MDIKEIAKKMTREEFIKCLKNGHCEIDGEVYGCPGSIGLNILHCYLCHHSTCKECWKQAIKDIKFKEENTEKPSKKLEKKFTEHLIKGEGKENPVGLIATYERKNKVLKANKELEKQFMISTTVINTRTQNQYDKLMKWADSKKILWYENEKASSESSKDYWNRYKEKTCICCISKRLTFGYVEFFKALDRPAVTFRQFFKQLKPEKPQQKPVFEVGDTVRVREDLESEKSYGHIVFVPAMEEHRGKVTTIVKKDIDKFEKIDILHLKIDNSQWMWTPDMLELVKKAYKEPMTIKSFEKKAHENAEKHGFWDDIKRITNDEYDILDTLLISDRTTYAELAEMQEGLNNAIGNRLMLIVSEVSEAQDGLRHKDIRNFKEELADVAIRLADLCGGLDIDLEAEIKNKMEKNKDRPYKHGKAF